MRCLAAVVTVALMSVGFVEAAPPPWVLPEEAPALPPMTAIQPVHALVPEAAKPRPLAEMIARQPRALPTGIRNVPQPTTGTVTTNAVEPGVRLELTAPETLRAGQACVYTLMVRNLAAMPAHQVRVEVELPPSVRYLTSDPPADQPGERLVWNLGILDPGQHRRLALRLRPIDEGALRLQASLTSTTMTAVITPVTRPRLTVALAGPETALVSDPVPFVIDVANEGTGPATGVRVRLKLPEGLRHSAGKHIEADLGTLAPGSRRTINVQAVASQTGPLDCELTAFGDGENRASAKLGLRIVEPALEVRLNVPTKCQLHSPTAVTIEAVNPGSAACAGVSVRTHSLLSVMQSVSVSQFLKSECRRKTSHACCWTSPRQSVYNW